MFCTTFYSYKGGVGRTLAMANVAVEMAAKGKKVLAVDFDLEAPGLASLQPFSERQLEKGLVDFIRSYETTGSVGKIADYITSCPFQIEGRSHSIDFLCAGKSHSDYQSNFSAIDWVKLYEQQDGFLLFEEIRAQWEFEEYDYVFIDSRTGFTDVGGICTRQLPDLVVVLFFPNDQNLRGLVEVVSDVRTSSARPHPIDLLFVASRVPRLDDEHGVLSTQLEKFETSLKYGPDEFLTIWQYDSLALLDDTLFVKERRQSSLSRSYKELATLISQYNIADPQGALEFLTFELDRISQRNWSADDEVDNSANEIISSLELIQESHPTDSIIQGLLADVFYKRRMLFESTVSSDRALAAFPKTETEAKPSAAFSSLVNLHRMRAFSEIGLTSEATDSALAILGDRSAQDRSVVDAVLYISANNYDCLPLAKDISALEESQPQRIVALAKRLSISSRAPEFAAAIVERMLERAGSSEGISREDVADIQIALIGDQKFELASSFVDDYFPDSKDKIQVLFNYTMSEWGRTSDPSVRLFELLYDMMLAETLDKRSANFAQCKALVEGVLRRDSERSDTLEHARNLIRTSSHIEFSCWNFRYVTPKIFEEHLDLISAMDVSGNDIPAFLATP